jgi:hypothetical protein
MPWSSLWSLLPVALRRRGALRREPDEVRRARELVAAVDAGGVPLNPALVNQVARRLGLEVSRQAPVEQTVERVRAALQRLDAV